MNRYEVKNAAGETIGTVEAYQGYAIARSKTARSQKLTTLWRATSARTGRDTHGFRSRKLATEHLTGC